LEVVIKNKCAYNKDYIKNNYVLYNVDFFRYFIIDHLFYRRVKRLKNLNKYVYDSITNKYVWYFDINIDLELLYKNYRKSNFFIRSLWRLKLKNKKQKFKIKYYEKNKI